MSKRIQITYLLALIILNIAIATPLEMRYKVCTPEDMRQQLATFCMRMSVRGMNSFLSLNSFGSIATSEGDNSGSFLGSDSSLVGVLKESRSLNPRGWTPVGRFRQQQVRKRTQEDDSKEELLSLIEKCCQDSCSIDAGRLLTACSP